MKGILDTHAFLWAVEDDPQRSATARAFIDDPANTIVLSVATVWEVVIKQMLGKLRLTRPIEDSLSELPAAGITLLPVLVDHALAVQGLPDAHRDPFDRILVAQTIAEGAVLVSIDSVFKKYPVTVVW